MSTPVIVVAHAPIATAWRSVTESILGGALENTWWFDFAFDDTQTPLEIRQLVAHTLKPQGILVCVDLRGATPARFMESLLPEFAHLSILYNINLAVLLRIASRRTLPLKNLMATAQDALLS